MTKPTKISIPTKNIIDYVNKMGRIKNKEAASLLLIAIKYNLNPAMVLITESDVQKLSQEGLISLDKSGKINLNEDLFNLTDNSREIKKSIEENIGKYRDIFKDLFVGSMGSPQGVREKLYKWLVANPDYSMEDVLKAAQYWVTEKKKQVDNPMFIGQADYFIYKRNQDGTESSRLSSVIDEVKEAGKDDDFITIL